MIIFVLLFCFIGNQLIAYQVEKEFAECTFTDVESHQDCTESLLSPYVPVVLTSQQGVARHVIGRAFGFDEKDLRSIWVVFQKVYIITVDGIYAFEIETNGKK